MTVLDAIIRSLSRAGEYNRDDQVAPAVILWPDRERQWEPVLPVLRERLPHLLTLGPYTANCKTGPAIWLRCMIVQSGATVPVAGKPEACPTIPILYLPGVSRQELRAVAECPPALMPLAELQYRAAFWSQVNHKDWTVLAFLQSADGGLGLDVARDNATLDAMKTALVKLIETDVRDLAGHRLEASDFHALLSPDPVREILGWMNDPKAAQAKLTAQQWEAFCHSCQDKFGFHPMKDGPLRAAEMMGVRQGNWGQVWDRFREAPKRYPNLPGWLRKAKPQDDDLFLKESDEVWPQSNEIHETALRNVLKGCAGKSAQAVVERIKEMEAVHGKRRSWVWAELDQAPLAVALKHLSTMAETCGKPVAGGEMDDLVSAYVNGGWCADAAVVDALGVVEKKEDIEAVQAVVRAVYLPWLEASALTFQKLVCGATVPVALRQGGKPEACSTLADVAKGTAILFADGLRFDLAQKLKAKLADKGFQLELGWRWTALPTVTPTAKPAASPITELFTGDEGCEEFRPRIRDVAWASSPCGNKQDACSTFSGKDLTSERFKQLLEERGCQVLSDKKLGQPDGVAWLEYGSIDSTGHKEGWKLAKRLPEELNGLAEAVAALLEGGWKKVRVVTDHGWLLVPGGLPKLELPKYLAETRWGRCALIKEGVQSEMPSVPWHWASTVFMAVPPGVGAFKASLEYAHGGLSMQECLVPELTVSSAAPVMADIAISSVKWVGLRCRVQASAGAVGLMADIRESIADKATSLVAKPKEIEPDAQTSLLVLDDRKSGAKATVVLVDASDTVVAKFPTVIGE
ncbi:MAG: BREX-1 system phosphatase PglZ type B [Chloroflexi bacterium]|nr:BREX-1 system phosphatase PglZ type B [Chloroflexota bacterium]